MKDDTGGQIDYCSPTAEMWLDGIEAKDKRNDMIEIIARVLRGHCSTCDNINDICSGYCELSIVECRRSIAGKIADQLQGEDDDQG